MGVPSAPIPEADAKAMEADADASTQLAIAVGTDEDAMEADAVAGLTSKELAEKLGISSSTVRGWAQIKKTPEKCKRGTVPALSYDADQKLWFPA